MLDFSRFKFLPKFCSNFTRIAQSPKIPRPSLPGRAASEPFARLFEFRWRSAAFSWLAAQLLSAAVPEPAACPAPRPAFSRWACGRSCVRAELRGVLDLSGTCCSARPLRARGGRGSILHTYPQTLDGPFSAVSKPIFESNIHSEACFKIYNICIRLHLWNPVRKPRKALL